MKTKLFILSFAIIFGFICGDDTPAKTEDEPPAINVICKKCNCDPSEKNIGCSGRVLSKMFPISDWEILNKTTVDYEVLQFDRNQFNSIDDQFPTLRFPVKIVDLSHNKINKISENVFTNLIYLEEINLSFNELTTESLTPEIFEGKYSPDEDEPLMSLKRLRLSYNLLHSLDAKIFEHTINLQELYLDNNPFKIIHTNILNAFSDLPQLQLLDMSRMELSSLPDDIFHPLRALKVLKLEGNLFKTIPQALVYAINVIELSLDENPIGDLNEGNAMPKMQKLEKLSMSKMESLKSIGKGGMSGLTNLTELKICHNRHLSFIDPSAFTSLDDTREIKPPIKILYLDNNNLTTLDNRMFNKWKEMKEIHLENNPWFCDCQLLWISTVLMRVINELTPQLIDDVKCSNPLDMVDRRLVDLSSDKMMKKCINEFTPAHAKRYSFLVVALLIGILLGMLAFTSILFYKMGCGRRSRPGYSRAYYKSAETGDDGDL